MSTKPCLKVERTQQRGNGERSSGWERQAAYRNSLGRVLQDLGDLAGARVQLERALAVGEAALGPDHPTVTTIRGSLLQALKETSPKGPPTGL